ncbi:4397_t:CDS:2, partial [Dentiscutata erythropus]
HTIVYVISKRENDILEYSNPRYSIYVYFIKDDIDQQSEPFLLYQNYGITISNVGLIDHFPLQAQLGNMSFGYKITEITNNLTLMDYGVFSNNTWWHISRNNSLDNTLLHLMRNGINITLSFPINPSSGNISVYQIINQDTYLLRQTYSATSSNCEIYNRSTLSCQTLSSIFNRINSNYIFSVDDNFVRSSSYNEPFRGIAKGIWRVITPLSYNSKEISDSTEATLHLNSGYLTNDNQSKLLDDLLLQIKESIPLMDDRLKITYNVQPDPSDSSKKLIKFSIDNANVPNSDPSVYDVCCK